MTLYIKDVLQPVRIEQFFNICDHPEEKRFWFDIDNETFDNLNQKTKDLFSLLSTQMIMYVNEKGTTDKTSDYVYNLLLRMGCCFYYFYNPKARPPRVSVDVEPLNSAGTKTMALGLPTRQLEDLPHTECNKFMYTCVITLGYLEIRLDPNNKKWCDDDKLKDTLGKACLSFISNFDNYGDKEWINRFRNVIFFDCLAWVANELEILNPGNTLKEDYEKLVPDIIYKDVNNKGEVVSIIKTK